MCISCDIILVFRRLYVCEWAFVNALQINISVNVDINALCVNACKWIYLKANAYLLMYCVLMYVFEMSVHEFIMNACIGICECLCVYTMCVNAFESMCEWLRVNMHTRLCSGKYQNQ